MALEQMKPNSYSTVTAPVSLNPLNKHRDVSCQRSSRSLIVSAVKHRTRELKYGPIPFIFQDPKDIEMNGKRRLKKSEETGTPNPSITSTQSDGLVPPYGSLRGWIPFFPLPKKEMDVKEQQGDTTKIKGYRIEPLREVRGFGNVTSYKY